MTLNPDQWQEALVQLANIMQGAGADFVPSASSSLVVLGLATSSNNLNRLAEAHQIGDGVDTNFFLSGSMLYNATGKWDRQRGATVFKTIAAVAVTAGTPANIWTPTSTKKFRLMGFAVSLSVAGSVIFKDNTTEIIRTPLMAAGIGQSSPPQMANGILSTVADQILKIDVSATGSVSGFVFGSEE